MIDPIEKLETLAAIAPGSSGRWYLQRWDDGLYGAGVAGVGDYDARDHETAEDAVTAVAVKVAHAIHTRRNQLHNEQRDIDDAAWQIRRLAA